MANCSNFTLKLSGHPFKLKQARDRFIENHHNFSLREIYEENFTHTPPTWELHGEGRWEVKIHKLAQFLLPFDLSGTLMDSEPGNDFFRQINLENGVLSEEKYADYMSDEHYEHCPDNSFWYEQLSYAIDKPDDYTEEIEFMLKHNIITKEYLEQCIQKNK